MLTGFILTMFICVDPNVTVCPVEKMPAGDVVPVETFSLCVELGQAVMDMGSYRGQPYVEYKCTRRAEG